MINIIIEILSSVLREQYGRRTFRCRESGLTVLSTSPFHLISQSLLLMLATKYVDTNKLLKFIKNISNKVKNIVQKIVLKYEEKKLRKKINWRVN